MTTGPQMPARLKMPSPRRHGESLLFRRQKLPSELVEEAINRLRLELEKTGIGKRRRSAPVDGGSSRSKKVAAG